jgi:hypothetical protein
MSKNEAMALMLNGKVAREIDERPGAQSKFLPVRKLRVWESERFSQLWPTLLDHEIQRVDQVLAKAGGPQSQNECE